MKYIQAPWKRVFYNSKAWHKCRASYIKSVHGLCERCGQPGKIVHHKTYLNARNVNDPSVSLNHDLLEYLCLTCHNGEHFGGALVAAGLRFDEDGNLVSNGVE